MRITAALLVVVAAMCLAAPALAAEAVVRPAADGIFAAFKTHPLVGLGDRHSLAEEGEFYRQLVRDPRFAAQVGNVVFELASSAHQATLDRYLEGADIPRAELRKVWTDVVGGAPFLTAVMYQQFLAEVRGVNLKLPPARRIRVWAGEPAVDWSKIKTNEELEPYRDRRDDAPAAIIEREILGRGKKALVIYGGLHFSPLPSPPGLPPHPGLKGLIEARHPGAFFIVEPYAGFIQPGCSEFLRGADPLAHRQPGHADPGHARRSPPAATGLHHGPTAHARARRRADHAGRARAHAGGLCAAHVGGGRRRLALSRPRGRPDAVA